MNKPQILSVDESNTNKPYNAVELKILAYVAAHLEWEDQNPGDQEELYAVDLLKRKGVHVDHLKEPFDELLKEIWKYPENANLIYLMREVSSTVGVYDKDKGYLLHMFPAFINAMELYSKGENWQYHTSRSSWSRHMHMDDNVYMAGCSELFKLNSTVTPNFDKWEFEAIFSVMMEYFYLIQYVPLYMEKEENLVEDQREWLMTLDEESCPPVWKFFEENLEKSMEQNKAFLSTLGVNKDIANFTHFWNGDGEIIEWSNRLRNAVTKLIHIYETKYSKDTSKSVPTD